MFQVKAFVMCALKEVGERGTFLKSKAVRHRNGLLSHPDHDACLLILFVYIRPVSVYSFPI